MGWFILGAVVLALLLAVLGLHARRIELRRMASVVGERTEAKERGSHQAQLRYPFIDLSACIGCGTCVAACPEDGVLGMVHGQASVVHGARCVGHGLCADECPVGAITLTLADVSTRRDLPAISEKFEAKGTPGLFLAGEVTGQALVRTAIAHGTAVANEVAARVAAHRPVPAPLPARRVLQMAGGGGERQARLPGARDDVLDLCIVGAGPSGLACSLGAKQHGLRFVTLEQEDEIGGTVAKYPRRKLVMTQPVDLPLHGRLAKTTYQKEELIDLWQSVATAHRLPIRTGQEFVGLERDADGVFTVRTRTAVFRARNVCLGLGRRGTPRKLGVPGEDLPKVAYSLMDAQSYQGRRILVVGGGDSAIEAALGLAEQPGNQVTLSYRKAAFFRLKARNEDNLREALAAGRLEVIYHSQVTAIEPDCVALRIDGDAQEYELPNDEVFVFAGGVPPFPLLEKAGVSFDPAERESVTPVAEQGTGLLRALSVGLCLALLALVWSLVFGSYYVLPKVQRPESPLHEWLRPSSRLGIGFGVAASVLIVANLLYLLRRSRLGRLIAGSLQNWLSYHIVTGVLAMLLALQHAAMAPHNTPGGHAFYCLVFLVITGAIGRYFYSYLPKAANGRELALEEIQSRLAALSGEWDAQRGAFAEGVRTHVEQLVQRSHWQRTFLQRLRALITDHFRLRRALAEIASEGRAQGIPEDQIERIARLSRRAYRTSQAASHYEDLRGLLASWRFFHRWVALLMVLLVVVHVIAAVRYANVF